MIWVIVDRLIKASHFIPIKATYSAVEYAKLYLNEIVRMHGFPFSIISDMGTHFTSHFWKEFKIGLRTKVKPSITFHPQIDCLAERTIQTI